MIAEFAARPEKPQQSLSCLKTYIDEHSQEVLEDVSFIDVVASRSPRLKCGESHRKIAVAGTFSGRP
jgi:hypothetical protein